MTILNDECSFLVGSAFCYCFLKSLAGCFPRQRRKSWSPQNSLPSNSAATAEVSVESRDKRLLNYMNYTSDIVSSTFCWIKTKIQHLQIFAVWFMGTIYRTPFAEKHQALSIDFPLNQGMESCNVSLWARHLFRLGWPAAMFDDTGHFFGGIWRNSMNHL